MKHFIRSLIIFWMLMAAPALAQGVVLQSGPVVPNHPAAFQSSGVIFDSGPASGVLPGGGINEMLLVVPPTSNGSAQPWSNTGSGPFGANQCNYDGFITGPRHYLCFSPNSSTGGPVIAFGALGGASPTNLTFEANGVAYNFPFTVGGVTGPATSVVNDLACWNNTIGSLLKDCGTATGTVSSVALTMPAIFSVGGSPITSFGTLAVTLNNQSANTVLAGPISGGAVTPGFRALVGADLPTPSAVTLGGVFSVTCPASNWVSIISTGGAPSCTQPSYGDIAGTIPAVQLKGAISGFVNKLRGTTLSQWYSGTSVTLTAGSSFFWTAEGVYCNSTGVAATASRITNPLTNPLSYYALKLLGAGSNTDVKCRFVVESIDAAPLAGQTVTFQLQIQNQAGVSITPTIQTKYAGTQDTWGSPVTDLATSNLQACANGATCTEGYTFNVNAGANNGYEVNIDFGPIGSGVYVVIGGGFDLRLTPGVLLGLNGSPPFPEVYTVERDAAWSRRFYEASYDNTTAPGATTTNGSVGSGMNNGSTTNVGFLVPFKVPKASVPTIAMWSNGGTLNDFSTGGSSGSVGTDNNASVVTTAVGTTGFSVRNTTTSAANVWIQFTADARIPGG
jgi:hypothetical protein